MRICASPGGFDKFWPNLGISGSVKNGSNDFPKILHTPLIFAELFFEKNFGPPKNHSDVIIIIIITITQPQRGVLWEPLHKGSS